MYRGCAHLCMRVTRRRHSFSVTHPSGALECAKAHEKLPETWYESCMCYRTAWNMKCSHQPIAAPAGWGVVCVCVCVCVLSYWVTHVTVTLCVCVCVLRVSVCIWRRNVWLTFFFFFLFLKISIPGWGQSRRLHLWPKQTWFHDSSGGPELRPQTHRIRVGDDQSKH